jgi:uncharacterized repeat protein (TIGR02543 family)
LTSVTNQSLTPQAILSDVFQGVTIGNIPLTVPASSVAAYEAANVWKNFKSVTGGGLLLSAKANSSALGTVTGTDSGLHPLNTSVTLTATPAENCAFSGWISGTDTLSKELTLSFTLTQNTMITASFARTCTVTFFRYDGTTTTVKVPENSLVSEPETPTRTGYTFGGWYKEAALTTPWSFTTDVVTDNLTLYAKWIETSTSVGTQSADEVTVYPNPTTGLVYVDNQGEEIFLYSLSGSLLLRSRECVLDLSGYASGVYFLRSGSKTTKVIKK